jgi:hypothetical protein
MNRRGAGIALLAIAAFLIGVKYLTAGVSGQMYIVDRVPKLPLFYVGSLLSNLAIISSIAGVTYLVWAEVEALAGRRK